MNVPSTVPAQLQRQPAQPDATDLLTAVLAMSADLDLHSLLHRIVQASTELTGARYAALGVIASDGSLDEFITVGLDAETQRKIGPPPRGQGLLGHLIQKPESLRLTDLSKHPGSVGVPAGHPPMTSFLGVPISIRGTAFGNLYLTDKSEGLPFTSHDEALVQALANAAGLLIENARSYWFSERRRQWLEASAQLAREIQPPMPLETSLRLTVERARAATGAVLAAIVQFPVDSHPVIAAADADVGVDPVEVIRSVVPDAKWVDRVVSSLNVTIGQQHALVVPLQAHLSDPGVLVVVVDKVRPSELFSEQEFLAEFADQAALSVDRAQAVIDREELAVLTDRERIARDLHDLVIQRLFAAGLKLNGTLTLDADEHRSELLSEVIGDLDLTIREIRTTIFGLTHPADGPLEETLDDSLIGYAPLLGIKPSLSVTGDLDQIPVEIVGHLRAVLREALSNVARHANATQVDVMLSVGASDVSLQVSDNGVGMGAAPRTGGLRNAAARATLLHGALEFTAGSPCGTVLTWKVPLRPFVA